MGRVEGWYKGKTICAPMVRVSNLAFRLVAAKYGADVVFTEELIAQKLVKTERIVNKEKGVVEYVLTEQCGKAKKKKLMQTLVFSTLTRKDNTEHPEGATLVLQMGANDPDVALRAAQHVEADIDGIDLNMGCPKAFSIKGGMGAALLTDPDKVKAILSNLSKNLSIPVSCKIRLLEDKTAMLHLLKVISETGVSAVTVHARFREQRSSEVPKVEYFKEIMAELIDFPIPVIFNGDVWGVKEVEEVKGLEKVEGAMIARGALQNPTCFSPSPLDKIEAHSELLKSHLRFGGGMREVKYTLTRSFQEQKQYKTHFDAMQHARTIPEMWIALGNDPEDAGFLELVKAHSDPLRIIDGVIEEYEVARKRRCEVEEVEGTGKKARLDAA
eukprot:TRINITY_DN7038_c4_g1_i1.p1 TRINITY_DN7038_c4_g1~~TRINITY_DN7038_c4_g1_i1.p1  ORF type:complete len:403 (+),score=118.75 TRINITY_DN7038_c4_g1_i1:57-1211(+)